MSDIDKMLEQAESLQSEGEWEIISKYRRNDTYVDDDGAVNIAGRRIDAIRENISVQGENHSQYIEFIMDRYYDGIDIAEQTLAIHYEVGDVSDEDAPINVYKNDTQIKFGWVVENTLTQYEATIEFCIWARGTLPDGNAYVLKTLPQRYEIKRGLEIAGGIIEPTNNWYMQFALTMDQKVAQATESADRAEQAANSIDGVVETVTTARDEVVQKASTVNTQHSEVENWHQEAEQFRNEAEQFRNQAEAITGIGLAEEGKPGIVQPDGVTTKVDADGKLTVIGGGGASEEAIRALEEFTQQLDQDISTLDTELEQTNQQLQSTTDKVDDVQESIEAGFKKQAQGEEIYTTDAVDGKLVDFALYGKARQNTTQGNQLFNYDAWKNIAIKSGTAVFENNGITITANVDDCYTEYRTDIPVPYPQEACIPVNEGDVLTLSWEEDTNKQGRIYIFPNGDTNGSVNTNNNKNKKLSYTVTSGVSFVTFRFGVQYAGDTIAYKNIMINKGSEPLPYEQYSGGIPSPNPNYPQEIETAGASGSIAVVSNGKNFIDYPDTAVNKNFWLVGDVPTSANIDAKKVFLPKGNYVFSFKSDVSGNNAININLYNKLGNKCFGKSSKVVVGYNEIPFEITEEVYSITSFTNLSGNYSEIQIEKGNQRTPFEPYKETKSLISTPNGLSGIKVLSGGNYTDENGQQWITDEIRKYADGSGEKVQRVGKIKLLGSIQWLQSGNWTYSAKAITDFKVLSEDATYKKTQAMCSHFVNRIEPHTMISNIGSFCLWYGISYNDYRLGFNSGFETIEEFKTFLDENDVYVYYLLADPIITSLTAEEVTEIEKLSMFNPVTNISNDADCGMSVTYATVKEALMLQEAYNQSKENAQEIVDIKRELSDTTFKVETIIERADLGIKETASGEEIHLTDSAEGKAVEFALYGKAKQNTTTGKNKLVYPYYHTSKTENGITFTVNEDGTVLANGTATGTANFIFKPRDNSPYSYNLEKGSYILSGCPINSGSYKLSVTKTIGASGTLIGSDLGNGFEFEVLEENYPYGIFISINSGAVLNNVVFKPMIRLASITDNTWEQPTNGATPRPDYPQPIEVSGESYNLLENTATSQTARGVTFTVNEDKSVTVNGTASENIAYNCASSVEFKNGQILNGCPSGGSTNSYYMRAIGTDYQDGAIDIGSGATLQKDKIYNVQIYIASGYTANNLTFYPMIRKASVRNDRYMPFGVNSVEVKSCGSNIMGNIVQNNLLTNASGVVETSNKYWSTVVDVRNKDNIFISGNYSLLNTGAIRFGGFTDYPTIGTQGYRTNIKKDMSVDVSNYNYVLLSFLRDDAGATEENGKELMDSFMVNKGTTALPWQPYKETLATIPTENGLAGIKVSSNGNYTDSNGQQWICDEVVKYADGSGEYIQRVGTDRITTTDSFITQSNGGLYSSDIYTSKPFDSMGKSTTVMCNYYNNSGNGWESKEPCIVTRTNNVSLRIYWQKEITHVSQAIEFMKNNEVIVKYILANPIRKPLTAEEIAEIEKLHTFYPVTNISNDFDCGIKVKYKCDGKNYIDNKLAQIAAAVVNNI